jgi:hypothetical protein
MADQAIDNENLNNLMPFLLNSIKEDIEIRFDDVLSKKDYDLNDIEDARDFVDSMLNFYFYLQQLFKFMEEG